MVAESLEDLAHVALAFPLFVKPVAEGTGKGVTAASLVRSTADLHRVCVQLLQVYDQPVLIESFLPGREFTTGILGTGAAAHAIGTMEIMLNARADAEVYSYRNKEHCDELVEYRLLKEAGLREAVERWPSPPFERSVVATRVALTFVATPLVGQVSWRSIRSPASTRSTPTCRFSVPFGVSALAS